MGQILYGSARTTAAVRRAIQHSHESLKKLVVLVCGFAIASTAMGAGYFVSPTGRDTGEGTALSPWSLTKACTTVKAGDTILLADGAYTSPIAPANSGEEGKPITFKAVNTGKATFDGSAAKVKTMAICLSGRSYVVIDGVKVTNVHRFVVAEGRESHHLTINHCDFDKASGWESCRFRDVGDGIYVTNCRLNGGTDLLNIRGGEGHLVENNFIGDASHTGLVLIMVRRSVIRGNRLTNRQWKMMEVFSTRDTTEPHRVSEYNLIEKNIFDLTVCSGIQYAGNRSILRNNLFTRCQTGMDWANYVGSAKTPEAWYNKGNRFYNNVLYHCGPTKDTRDALDQSGIKSAEPVTGVLVAMDFATNITPPANYGDNICVNNIFFGNAASGGKTEASDQVSFDWDAGPEFGFFFNNSFLAEKPNQNILYWCDARYAKPPLPGNMTLQKWQDHFPKNAAGNIEVDPQFVAPDKGDFHLKPASPCIDAGRCLTTAAADSSGTSLKVADALYFTDGYGIKGVEGDVVRVGDARARVVKVDYTANVLTLDKPINCKAGDGVSMDYIGNAPDVGAFERR